MMSRCISEQRFSHSPGSRAAGVSGSAWRYHSRQSRADAVDVRQSRADAARDARLVVVVAGAAPPLVAAAVPRVAPVVVARAPRVAAAVGPAARAVVAAGAQSVDAALVASTVVASHASVVAALPVHLQCRRPRGCP